MKPFTDLEEYDKAIYRLFGSFPFLLLVAASLLIYVGGILMVASGSDVLADPAGLEGISNAFFKGVITSVGLYYFSRIFAVGVVKSSHALVERESEGVFIPCVSHGKFFELAAGSIVLLPDRLYFEPRRPFGGAPSFDYKDYSGFTFALSSPRDSHGLFFLTKEKYMMTVKDSAGQILGKFIMPKPEHYLPTLQELI